MQSRGKLYRVLAWLGVALIQLIMTQVVTFLASLALPGMERYQQNQPIVFASLLGICFSIGVFLAGWLALKWGWLKGPSRLPARLIATLIGAFLPLFIALLIYPILEPGNPFFFISEIASVLGFHVPGWIRGKIG